ncbi:hypothetical protein TNCV_2906801 [Trichonephila clavipes]|nr:hypothetical protein TNCV_2906801 [Trichonephila clavipes]
MPTRQLTAVVLSSLGSPQHSSVKTLTDFMALSMSLMASGPRLEKYNASGLTTSYILHGIDTEYTIDDIKSELENYNYAIFDIQRFTKKTESGFKPIKTVKVTQIGCSIPDRVPIGFEMIKTTLYYEKPRQCTNCWKFGHLQNFVEAQ